MFKDHININSVLKFNQSTTHFSTFPGEEFLKRVSQLACFSKKNILKYTSIFLCWFHTLKSKSFLPRYERYKMGDRTPCQVCPSDLSPFCGVQRWSRVCECTLTTKATQWEGAIDSVFTTQHVTLTEHSRPVPEADSLQWCVHCSALRLPPCPRRYPSKTTHGQYSLAYPRTKLKMRQWGFLKNFWAR